MRSESLFYFKNKPAFNIPVHLITDIFKDRSQIYKIDGTHVINYHAQYTKSIDHKNSRILGTLADMHVLGLG